VPAASKKRKSDDAEEDASSSKNKRQAVADGEDVPDEENPKVYVRGLPWKATHEEVKEFFAECGAIKSVELPLMGDGRSSGTAIIEFDSPEGSAKAMEQNGADFNGRWLNSKCILVLLLLLLPLCQFVHL
jgi:RNA recognition motif-containing protein